MSKARDGELKFLNHPIRRVNIFTIDHSIGVLDELFILSVPDPMEVPKAILVWENSHH
jgi:hypothetical protein